MTRLSLILAFGALLCCADKPSLVPIQDGSLAMVKDVSDDCEHRRISQPENCIWEARYDLRLERTAEVRIQIGPDGVPLNAEGIDEGARDAAACAMSLRYEGPGACVVKLRLVRYASDVAAAGRGDPNIDCTGYAGPGAACFSSTGASPIR